MKGFGYQFFSGYGSYTTWFEDTKGNQSLGCIYA